MPTIDLSFGLDPGSIPLDHGYALFSALSRIVPGLHGDLGVGVHPIRGRRADAGMLTLDENSRLRIRLPEDRVTPYLALAGRELDLDGLKARVGSPSIVKLASAPNLASRLVTFQDVMTPEQFADVVRRDLEAMGVAGTPELVPAPRRPGEPIRRVLNVKGRRIVGFALRVTGLSAWESLALQAEGLGARRRFGAGVFTPFHL
ncbi:type I-MYXAN CRISPR-associated protein Cas6/Cmx6 [Paludisphaera sp.]|uniref:type I-MYXAN CRISPR-associated protein Cas6/Cmx6 n=1 Tax=Paludisphaera sp. TaxID=2017432 RepID=UPI00301B8D39